MPIEHVGTDVGELTPETLKAFLALPPLPGEREIRPARIRRQREWIAAREFYSVRWATVLDKRTGTIHRCNGQHTAVGTLSNLDGLKFPTKRDGSPLSMSIERWEVDNIEDEGLKVFDCFDSSVSARSITDRMSMAKAGFPDVKRLKPGFLVAVTAIIEEHNKGQASYNPCDARYRGEVMLPDPKVRKFALWLAQFESCDNRRFIKLKKPMSACYGWWLKNAPAAEEFWTAVFYESDPDDTSASRMLAAELVAALVKVKKGDKLRLAAIRAQKRFEQERGRPASPAPQPAQATP